MITNVHCWWKKVFLECEQKSRCKRSRKVTGKIRNCAECLPLLFNLDGFQWLHRNKRIVGVLLKHSFLKSTSRRGGGGWRKAPVWVGEKQNAAYKRNCCTRKSAAERKTLFTSDWLHRRWVEQVKLKMSCESSLSGNWGSLSWLFLQYTCKLPREPTQPSATGKSTENSFVYTAH